MPKTKIKGKDGFLVLRDDLDEGYEVLGSFKDLFDSQGVSAPKAKYNDEEVKGRRKLVLNWVKKFIEDTKMYEAYLEQILTNRIEHRPKDQLSQFYWGISDQSPRSEEPMAQAFRRLLADLIENGQAEWPDVRKIKNPTKNIQNIEAFHNFRKRMRTVLKITTYFPELMSLHPDEAEFLAELSSQYGVISDQVSRMEIALKEKVSDKKIDKIIKETDTLWKDLQRWEDQQDILKKLDDLRLKL